VSVFWVIRWPACSCLVANRRLFVPDISFHIYAVLNDPGLWPGMVFVHSPGNVLKVSDKRPDDTMASVRPERNLHRLIRTKEKMFFCPA
jgi:hypothetical protein